MMKKSKEIKCKVTYLSFELNINQELKVLVPGGATMQTAV